MKLRKFFLAILVFCLACPLTVHAKTYTMSNTDISISVDDSSWYVFTRDNLLNNSELKELGIASNEMRDILEGNMAYMDALLIYEDGDFVELLIRKTKIEDSFTNLSNYSNEQVLELAELLGEKHNTKNYSVYENQYKFVKLEYFDSTYDYYICEFLTMVNKDNYTLTFQSPSAFTNSERDEIQNIVDSIKFDIDSSMEELIPVSSQTQNNSSLLDQIIETGITSAISGGLLGLTAVLIGKRRRKQKEKKQDKALVDASESKEPFKTESMNEVVPENLDGQPNVIHPSETSLAQATTAQKDVAIDKGFDEIKKYKELLDLGIITQEEFDAKKKELLSL